MNATKHSPARASAQADLAQALRDLNATNGEFAAAMTEWAGRTSGRRPGYAAATEAVLSELEAARKEAAGSKSKDYQKAVRAARGEAPVQESTPEPAAPEAPSSERPVGVGEFVRQSRKVRRSGTTVTVYDTHHADATEIPGANAEIGRWVVVCEDHKAAKPVKTYTEAWKIALTPAEFCKTCKSHG
jgi:hypothetical protein